MLKMRLVAETVSIPPNRAGDASAVASTQIDATPSRASRPALPKLFELFAKLLTGSAPVCADAVSQLCNLTFDFHFILLEPGHIEFLSRSSAFELACNVFFVIADNPGWIKQLVK